jgi:hypothetical protein
MHTFFLNLEEREECKPGKHLRNKDFAMDVEVNSWEGLEWITVPQNEENFLSR